jgi:flagellin
MLQTAEGGLEQTQNSLQRMRELAVQASNDTLTGSDREQIQREVDALSKEIQRISDQTQFNTKNLLDGSLSFDGDLGTQQLQVGANDGETIEFNVSDMGTGDDALDVAGSGEAQEVNEFTASGKSLNGDAELSVEKFTTSDGNSEFRLLEEGQTVASQSANGKGLKYNIDSGADFASAGTEIELAAKVQDGQEFQVSGGDIDNSSLDSPTIDGKNEKLEAGDYTISTKNVGTQSKSVRLFNDQNDRVAKLSQSGEFVNTDGDTKLDFSDTTTSTLLLASDGTTTFQDGANISVGGPDITSTDDAKNAIQTLDQAIEDVSSERAEIGALQNRLETTISVDDISSENLQAARSRIRDADVAQESVKQTRGNILVQAGTSVLAQANQNPQSALQLLGG